MPQPRCRPGFAQKPQASRFITETLFTDDLQRHRALEIDVERFVSNPHRPATQLERLAVFVRHQLVVLKSFRCPIRCWSDPLLERRLAGLNTISQTLAEHAHRTEFHCSRKLIAAAWADASGLRFHGSDRPSQAIKASQRAWISLSACSCVAWESGAWL